MMNKRIKSDEEYKSALQRMEELGDDSNFEVEERLIKEFDDLESKVNAYEKAHFPIKAGDPIQIIKLKMTYLGLVQKDLIPYIGSKGVVSEVLNRKRNLSKSMIRKLSEFLSINQEILNVDVVNQPNEGNFIRTNHRHVDDIIPFGLSRETLIEIGKFSRHVRERGMLFNVCSN